MMENITLSASPGTVEMLPCRWITGQSMSTSQQVHYKSKVITFSLYMANISIVQLIHEEYNVFYLQMLFQMIFYCAYYEMTRLCCRLGVTLALPNKWFHVHVLLTVLQRKVDIASQQAFSKDKTSYIFYYVNQSSDSHNVAFSHTYEQNTAQANIL